MIATVKGVPGGIDAGDAITKIEIAWRAGSETADQAMAAGRGVVLTAPADISAFQGSGYLLNSANLVQGQTYTGAVRVTESRGGAGAYPGAWKDSGTFSATLAFLQNLDFESPLVADSSLGWKDVSTNYGTGGSQSATISTDLATVGTHSLKLQTTAAGSSSNYAMVQQVTTDPAAIANFSAVSVDWRIASSGTSATVDNSTAGLDHWVLHVQAVVKDAAGNSLGVSPAYFNYIIAGFTGAGMMPPYVDTFRLANPTKDEWHTTVLNIKNDLVNNRGIVWANVALIQLTISLHTATSLYYGVVYVDNVKLA